MLTRWPSPAGLARNEVHIWQGSVEPTLLPQRRWLSAEETARMERLGTPAAKAQFLAGRVILRGVLSGYLDRDPASLNFSFGDYGKPSLEDSTGLEFNLSHSGDEITLALAQSAPVGADIEAWRRLDRLDALAQRCLAPCEYAELERLSSAEKAHGFFRFWVRKEALGKASGRGIMLGLQHCVSSLKGPPLWLDVPAGLGTAEDWSLAELPLREGFSAAVTVRAADARFYWGRAHIESGGIGFEKLKSLRYSTPDCVLGNAAVDSARYPSR